MEAEKTCPLTRNQCNRSCAWFDDSESECAVLTLSFRMEAVSGNIESLETQLIDALKGVERSIDIIS